MASVKIKMNTKKEGRGKVKRGRPPKPIAEGQKGLLLFNLQKQVDEAIKRKRMNYTQFAKAMDATPAYVSRLLHGDVNFSVKTLERLAKVLDCGLVIQFRKKSD